MWSTQIIPSVRFYGRKVQSECGLHVVCVAARLMLPLNFTSSQTDVQPLCNGVTEYTLLSQPGLSSPRNPVDTAQQQSKRLRLQRSCKCNIENHSFRNDELYARLRLKAKAYECVYLTTYLDNTTKSSNDAITYDHRNTWR